MDCPERKLHTVLVGEYRSKISRMEDSSFVLKALPFVAMIVTEFATIGAATLSKAALSSGLNKYVYIVYYDTLGIFLLLPCFLCHFRSGKSLPLTFPLLCRIFGLSLIGRCLGQICFYIGLSYASITLSSAIGSLIPIFTYLLALCFRIERLDLKKSIDQIKLLGTFIAVVGALVVTLYKGPALLATHDPSNSAVKLLLSEQSNWPLGGLVFTIGNLLKALWNILQAETVKVYPDEITIVFFYNFFGTIQVAVASLFLVDGQSAWILHRRVEIIAVLYAAFSLSILTNTVTTWCLHKKGPVFVSMFEPLNVAIAAFMGFVFLADGIYLGSVIGSAAIIVGFYAVMWGQEKTKIAMTNKIGELESAPSSTQVTPLLQDSHNSNPP